MKREILHKLIKFYTSAAGDAIDKYHVCIPSIAFCIRAFPAINFRVKSCYFCAIYHFLGQNGSLSKKKKKLFGI